LLLANLEKKKRVVFRNEHLSLRNLLLSCKAEAAQWKARMPKRSKNVIEAWSRLFDMSVNNTPNVT
jgi:hypothetical protein